MKNESTETDELPEDADDISACVEHCKQATKSGNTVLASKWYLRSMLRVRQDAYCTLQPNSAYGAIQRVHRKLMRLLKPLQGIENAPNLEFLQQEQLRWLRKRTESGRLPPPTALLQLYSDSTVGYDPEKARRMRKRRKLEQSSGELDRKTGSACERILGQGSSTSPVHNQTHAKKENEKPLLRLLTSSPLLSRPSLSSLRDKNKESEKEPVSMQMYSELHWPKCRKRFVDERFRDA